MSHQISGENAQGVFVPHSLNENSESLPCSINDMEISCTNSTVKAKKNSRDITRSDSSFEDDLKNVRTNDDIPTNNEELYREPDDGCIDENFILKVSHLDISEDKAVNADPTINQGSSQDLMSEPLKNIKKHTDSSDSSDNDDNTNVTLMGLQLGDLANDDEIVDSDEDSESESEEYYSEDDDEIQMKEVAKFGIKKRKVDREESWLSVLGVDKVSTELPHISTLELNNKEEFTHMGDLECIIDKIVTIAGLPGMPAYDLDTLLFLEEGQKVLGYVLDVMGPISAPVYIVPMSSTEAIRDLQLRKGTKVYCAPKSKYTKYVLLQELMKMRRSDSSWTADAEMPSECQEFSEDEQGHLEKTPIKDKTRKCSQERYRQFVKDMNRANQRDTRLHKMADSHRTHLDRMGGLQSVHRQLRDSRTRNQSSGTKSSSEGRRSRPLYRNNAHGVGAAELQSWTVVNPAASTARNSVPVMPPFDPSIPPPNCAESGYYLPSEDSLFSSFVGFIPSENFNSQDFERSVSRPNRQNNLPGPSGWFN
ncbi:H/ACA ribonucleoprotein complex non-core subunit NAF1-like [Coccinella septempunctata]|uniref:H/ACA ribonucleoprotein complex non-core subunit NAF1-like n=1 Tax=Coccinella septempunctata TaxID=41139 RepID=UPI001D05FACA|nr:H/ACA ribonucleoprotein complex non-core subunit NAF1-like [Coccinella septempunctata]